MFFRALAALVAADAFDRRMRERQRRAWIAADEARTVAAARRPDDLSDPHRALRPPAADDPHRRG